MPVFMQTPRSKPPGFRIIASILLVAFSGCAYYNTFYLAKRYYREGQKAQERSVTDEPSPEAKQKYDAAARQCAKILVDYPKSKWADDAIYLMGASLYGKGDYAAAIKKFGELRANAPKSPFVPDSKLVEALSRLRGKEYLEAQALFHEVESQYPSFKRKWELYYYGGECEVGLKNYPGALVWYARAVKEADQKRERADALRRTGDALFESERYDSAQAVYAQCIKVEERGGRRLDVALRRGESLERLKRFDDALALYQYWKPYAANENRGGEFSLRIYGCLALLGRVNEAIGGYRNLIQESAHTPLASEAQFRLGYLYEAQLGDLDAAGREYEKLKSEGGMSEFQTQAARRYSNLNTLKQYRQTLLSDTTQSRARAAFLLAELYYFQLEKLDSALVQYSTVEYSFPKSAYAPKSAFARLWIQTHDLQDTAAAAALTDTIAARYRKTRYAESALYLWKRWSGRSDERTALLDSMVANPDTTLLRERMEELLRATLVGTPQIADSSGAPAPNATTPAQEARLDSLAAYTRDLHRAIRQGRVPPNGAPTLPTPGSAPADTSLTKPPPPADTTSTRVIGPSR